MSDRRIFSAVKFYIKNIIAMKTIIAALLTFILILARRGSFLHDCPFKKIPCGMIRTVELVENLSFAREAGF